MKKLKRDFPLKLKIGFKKVFDAYKKNKLSEDVALQQAQVARICHASDFNFDTGKVTLWNPTMLTQ